MKQTFPLLLLFLAAAMLLIYSSRIDQVVAQSEAPVLPSGPFVARLYYDSIADLQRLDGYDLWEYNDLAEQYVLVSLDSSSFRLLQGQGWDLQVDEVHTGRMATTLFPFSEGYHTVEELYAALSKLNERNPDLAELVPYGESVCLAQNGCTTPGGDLLPGFELLALRITNEDLPGSSGIQGNRVLPGSKPVFFLLANIHARELATAELALSFAEHLLEEYGRDPIITYLIDWHELWIIPTANPDGHWLVELGAQPSYGQGAFYQRKNAHQDANGDGLADCLVWPPQSSWQYGIDLNRNHSFSWAGAGASSSPCDQTYHGPGPASEPEISALQTLVTALIPDQRGDSPSAPAPLSTKGLLLTMHSFGNLILWPWGGTDALAPNQTGLQAIGDQLGSLTGYASCQASHCLYLASGTTDDWAYGELGIPAFTFEIGRYFIPDFQEVEQTLWPENLPALLYAARLSAAPYEAILGPEVSAIQTSVTTSSVQITATLDNTDHGRQPIASAAYTIDRPYWNESAESRPLMAVDGQFDESQESVSASLPLAELGPGEHIVYITGTDVSGMRGLIGAAFINREPALPHPTYFPLFPN